MIELLPVVGPVLSIIGALLTTSLKPKQRLAGFTTWIVSNTMLAAWSLTIGAPWLFLMYAMFGVTSMYGVMTNAKALSGALS